MGPLSHTVASVGLSAIVWLATGSPQTIPVVAAAGILPDLDHVVDFFDSKERGRNRHMWRPFHAWEFFIVALIVALAFYPGEMFLAALVGYLSHLVIDQATNRVHPLAYSMIYRASKGFRRRHLTPKLFDGSHRFPPGPIPLWGRLEPSLWRLITRLRGGE